MNVAVRRLVDDNFIECSHDPSGQGGSISAAYRSFGRAPNTPIDAVFEFDTNDPDSYCADPNKPSDGQFEEGAIDCEEGRQQDAILLPVLFPRVVLVIIVSRSNCV